MPDTAHAYSELRITVRRDLVSFEIDGANYGGAPDFCDATLEGLRQLRLDGTAAQYGSLLRSAAFKDRAAAGFEQVAVKVNRGEKCQLRFAIDSGSPELHLLRWECLFSGEHDAVQRRYGASHLTPLSRYLHVEHPTIRDLPDELRVLVVISNPDELGKGEWQDFKPLHEGTERAILTDAFAALGRQVDCQFLRPPANPSAITEKVREGRFNILHIVGHGHRDPRGHGHLLLERQANQGRAVFPVDERHLASVVSEAPDLCLVVLAACHSAERSEADVFLGLAPAMVRQSIPAVVAMQERVEQSTARVFATDFYRVLLGPGQHSGLVDVAVNMAREKLLLDAYEEREWGWSVPVLFLRGDARLFKAHPAAGAERDEPSLSRRAPAQTASPPEIAEEDAGSPQPRPVVLSRPPDPRVDTGPAVPDKTLTSRQRWVLLDCQDLLDVAFRNGYERARLVAVFALHELGELEELTATAFMEHVVENGMDDTLHQYHDMRRGSTDWGSGPWRGA